MRTGGYDKFPVAEIPDGDEQAWRGWPDICSELFSAIDASSTPARIEEMMMNTRMQLLKIPEVLSIKCGKRIDPDLPWPFFIAIDFESMDRFEIFREDPIHVKFMEDVIKPNTAESLVLDFEMDPGKDVRFS